MRILHVISRLDVGSAEHHLRLLVRELPHECEVVSLSRPGLLGRTLRAAGVRVHEVSSHADTDPGAVLRLRQLIRAGDFDVVHTHLPRAGVQGRLAARLAGVRYVVSTQHSLPGGRRMQRATERLGRITVATSPAIAGRLHAWGVPQSRLVVIRPGIDPAEFRFDPALRATAREALGIAPDTPVVGTVGRLEPDRRLDRLIRAIGGTDATLLLVGDGSARTALARLAEIEGVAERVVFGGAVPHARQMLSAMDVFAAPGSAPDQSALEALAAGLPAVYASCAPLDDLARARVPIAGAQRLSQDPESLPRALRAELLCLGERGGERLGVRVVGGRDDAARMAGSVARLYEHLAGRRHPVHWPVKPRPVKPRAAG